MGHHRLNCPKEEGRSKISHVSYPPFVYDYGLVALPTVGYGNAVIRACRAGYNMPMLFLYLPETC